VSRTTLPLQLRINVLADWTNNSLRLFSFMTRGANCRRGPWRARRASRDRRSWRFHGWSKSDPSLAQVRLKIDRNAGLSEPPTSFVSQFWLAAAFVRCAGRVGELAALRERRCVQSRI